MSNFFNSIQDQMKKVEIFFRERCSFLAQMCCVEWGWGEGVHTFFSNGPVIPAREKNIFVFFFPNKTRKIFIEKNVLFRRFFFSSRDNCCGKKCFLEVSCLLLDKVSLILFIVKLDRLFLSTSGADLMRAGGHSSGFARARLTGWESSWRRCSLIQIPPEQKRKILIKILIC